MKTQILAPKAPKHPKTFNLHGDRRVDEYFWLKDRTHPDTMPYIEAENAYFASQMKPLSKLKTKLFKEMKARIKEDDSSPPAPYDEFVYYSKFKKGQQYSMLCRKPKKGGRGQVFLDFNKLAAGKKYFSSSGFEISFDHRYALYTTDFDGSERYQTRVRDLGTGKDLKDLIPNTGGNFAWAADNRTFFYVVLDDNLRPYRVYRHEIGTNPKDDVLVFEEKAADYFVGVWTSLSGEYVFIQTGGKITNETWFLKTSDPLGDFRCIEPRKDGVEYDVRDRDGEFWILTNQRAKNFQIMRTPVEKPGRRNWKVFLSHSAKILRTDISVFRDFLVVSEQQNGLPQIRIHEFKGGKNHIVSFKDAAYVVGVTSDNYEFGAQSIRLHYSSLVTPPTIYDYDFRKKRFKTLKVKEVKGHQPKKYKLERVWVRGHDGVRIPMTMLSRKGIKKEAPGYLYGYGSYGSSVAPGFPSGRDVYRLVERGFVYAIAHIRGGSEMGRHWYEDGKFLKKKNTFHDFISCAEHLLKTGRVGRGRLAACGGSAGGMLMGACMNMRPGLFKVIVAHVPFVDVLNTMLNKELLLTQLEFKEWGNPEDKRYYNYIKSYSPYDNVKRQAYPNLFVTCGLNDPRVTYWEPAKWVARLREMKTDRNQILFKINMGAGHFGQSGRFDYLHQIAEEYAYILSLFGMKA